MSAVAELIPRRAERSTAAEERADHPTQCAPRWLLRGAASVYGCGIAARNRAYDAGRGVRRVPLPVISVGNLTAGGTGKTPAVVWIVRRLRDAGLRPAVALRGYRAPRGGEADEARELREAFGGEAASAGDVPLIVGGDRHATITRWLAEGGRADCIVLDDGFQHRRLGRNADLVLIDAQRPALDDLLLPAGWLREPVTALRRATAVIVTRCASVDEALSRRITELSGCAPIAWSNHAWTHLKWMEPGGESASRPVTALQGLRIAVMLGIGHPHAMERALEAAGANIVHRTPVRDHHAYTEVMVRPLASAVAHADALVTTAKDLVKLAPLLAMHPLPVPVIVPVLSLDVHTGAEALEALLLEAVSHWKPAAK